MNGSDCGLGAPSLLLVKIPNRYGSRSQQQEDDRRVDSRIFCKSDLGTAEQAG